MRVKLGDGRTVESPTGITKLPPGPMPETLAAEMARPTVVRKREPRAEERQEGSPVPRLLRAVFPPSTDPDRAAAETLIRMHGHKRAAALLTCSVQAINRFVRDGSVRIEMRQCIHDRLADLRLAGHFAPTSSDQST